MVRRVLIGVGLLFVIGCGPTRKSSAPSPAGATGGAASCAHQGEAEPPGVAGITAAHNAIRCKVQRPSGGALPPLTWSSALAAEAQGYANKLTQGGCNLQHSQTQHGENLFAGTGKYAPADVVGRWASEERCFAYAAFPGSCSCTCGHYTQLVWGDTQRVGCGMSTCADGSQVWVCNYDPAGNYTSAMPY